MQVYLCWHSSVFGKTLVKLVSDAVKAKMWLSEMAIKNHGDIKGQELERMIVRREAGNPLNQIGIDDGYTWWVEAREVT